MEKDPLTETVVYARRGNHDFIFEGFVSTSDVAFVSAESISMISEVLSLKKPCVSILCERIHAKHKVFLESIRDQVQFLMPPFSLDGINPVSSSIFEDNVAAIRAAIQQRL
ncbi:MAG: mitochondrial fission ELM1 family protein, partial [Candidatus Omnitrophica bacterium]|nr:mitochondrial fission ELM1 family protein [Candidatus Omnitrophota bacterium]